MEMIDNPYQQMSTLPINQKNEVYSTARSLSAFNTGASPERTLPVVTSRAQIKHQQKRFNQFIVKPFTDQELNK